MGEHVAGEAGGHQSGADLASDTWRPYSLKVNSPLRTAGDRVYLFGHGYALQFTVTFPDGDTLKFYGWLDSFAPSSHTEGNRPTAAGRLGPAGAG